MRGAQVAGREVEHLDAIPGMGAAFARAMVPSRTSRVTLPRRISTVHDVTQNRARLADYARVCGFTLRDAVPPTWLHVLTFPLHIHLLGDPQSSVKLVGAVHTSNSMTLHRPVTADERLELSVHLEGPRPHRRGALVDLIGQVRVDGEPVWDGVTTYLASGASVEGEPEEVERAPFEPRSPQARWRLPADLGRQYRRVSQDPNPIHTSRVAAKAFGFARPIIHGMWTHARALAALENRLPAAFTTHVDFVKPILLPSSVGFVASETPGGVLADVVTKDGAKPLLRMRVEEAA
ncbi:MaoC/PaaZ C-terminal domain-containing protein [Demequina sp. NBRC 110056]|uniref:MaoC/PaaZ C-terminal domain-containing protein n=1 Tax=Demequina sp. NBRC 110056 TaxID=1570345 RepID=UPI0009FE1EEE|nr:MaoC/PaaZ C-terminal domain-containing protein [Demequina sp. NBRC 110056]